jgi:predicted AAA+ superfamily ATPase
MNWGEISGGKQSLDPFDEKHGGRHKLVKAVIDRMGDPAFRDIIVVQGPPGCGKSAFALRLANELLSLGMQPILARFRDFRLTTFDRADDLVEDALRIGPIAAATKPITLRGEQSGPHDDAW